MALRHKSSREANELLPEFTDITEIGAGEFATVYSARESDSGRPVALKLLNVRDISPDALGSLLRETSVLETLSAHPNIVTLYRTDVTPDGRPVLVMELCQGPVTTYGFRKGARGPAGAVSVAIKIAGALATAHRAGMLHGSVTPQKLLMTQHGEPALADLGVARQRSSSGRGSAVAPATLHAAPEMLEGTTATTATDVYGLASTLYQLLAGHAAFRWFQGETAAAVIVRILRDPVPPLLVEGVPMALWDVLVQAMAKNPLKRPSSALEFADQLKGIEDAQSWPQTSYFVVGEEASRFIESMPPSEIDSAGRTDQETEAWWPSESPDDTTSPSSDGSGYVESETPAHWFSDNSLARASGQAPPRFDGGWVPPAAEQSNGPTVRHAPAPVVGATPQMARRVVVPTPVRQIASQRVVATPITPNTSPNTGRHFAPPDLLLELLSSADVPQRDLMWPDINPRFADPEPAGPGDSAEDMPPDMVEQTILRSGRRDSSPE